MSDPRAPMLVVRFVVPHAGRKPGTKLPPPKPEAVELASAGLYKVVGEPAKRLERQWRPVGGAPSPRAAA